MKIDVISIFPEYLSPLKLSLLGKAQSAGLVDIAVHDLRAHTSDNHNTVDDTPYGGGAGMVMLPEVWAKSIDSLVTDGADLIILTPAGKKFNQKMAESFSSSTQLIFACGRYEGIDQRVVRCVGAAVGGLDCDGDRLTAQTSCAHTLTLAVMRTRRMRPVTLSTSPMSST